MRRFVRTPIAIGTLLAACVSAGSTARRPGAAVRVEFQRVTETERFWSGVKDSVRLVVRDSGAWQAVWDRIQAKQSAVRRPTIDFSREMVIVVGLGSRGSTGHSIEVDSILAYESSGVIEVHLTKTQPMAGTEVGMLATAPLDAVRLPRHRGDVRFVEQQRERSDP